MQDSVLETLLVVLYTIKIWTQNLLNFIVKFGSKAEICWKLEEGNSSRIQHTIWATSSDPEYNIRIWKIYP